MAIYTRESDGAVLDYSHVLGSFDRIIGVYDFQTVKDFSYGSIAQARELASYLEQKTFTIELVLTDTSGAEQLADLAFFKKGGKYTVTGPEFSLQTMSFWVVAIDTGGFFSASGPDIISITCQAEFGDFVQETVVPIYHQEFAGGVAWPEWSGIYSNATALDQTIRVELKKDSPTNLWVSHVNSRLLKGTVGITFTLGMFNTLGDLQSGPGRKVLVDSYSEVIEGPAVISPMTAAFFKVKPGEIAPLKLEALSGPPTTVPYTLDIYAYSVERSAA